MTDTIPSMPSPSSTSVDSVMINSEQKFDFFVYGTLCVPAVLVRVLGRKCEDLKFQDALLPDYTRHSVKDEDYPAIVGRSETTKLLPPEVVLTSEEYNTRGTLVSGLTYRDVQSIDVFEGTEYSRRKVVVQTVAPPSSVQNLPRALTDPSSRESLDNLEAEKLVQSQLKGSSHQDGQEVGKRECWTYVWSADLDRLEPKVWDFSTFVKERADFWTSANTTEYDEVDRHRALQTMPGARDDEFHRDEEENGDGEEDRILGGKVDGLPDFGHNMLQHFQFEKGYLNMNQGSYGSVPRPVAEARQKLLAKIEGNPDRFMRRDWLPLLNEVRARTADIIGATPDECVIVPNTTHGINTIVNNITWQSGDRVMIFSSTYGAIAQMMKYYCDQNPDVELDIVDLPFPLRNDVIVDRAEEALSHWNLVAKPNYTGQAQATGKTPDSRVRLVIVDSIVSNPGVVMPWERVVSVCKKYGAYSLVDAAHSIGQHKVNVDMAQCDFFVTNCQKWLYSARSAAVMYVPLRNQHLVRSSFPVSAGYESTRFPTQGIDRKWDFALQYDWNGTCDWSSFFSVSDAIAWRKEIGGEDRIMEYCHTLAVEGGKRLSHKWGTKVMQNPEKTHTAAMVNVELPYIPPPKDVEDQFKQLKYMEERMYDKNIRFVPYVHTGKWWGRFSAQIFLELSDFDKMADQAVEILQEVKDGKHLGIDPPETDGLHRPEDVPAIDE